MKKGEIINGYQISEDFKVAGGRSKITFAEKDGKEYFIKEFLSPKYPTLDSPGSEKVKERKRQDCVEFERHHRTLNEAISSKCAFGGNLVFAVDFFRQGACYYKVTEKIDVSSISIEEISRLDFDKILIIAKSVAHSVQTLHSLKIVHGDLKPDNILIKEVRAGYSGKLIDFDDSYFEREPPKNREELVGTPEYYSPEQLAYIVDEDGEVSGDTLTCKSDIFTLGIIFHEYFAGVRPSFDTKYNSVCSAVSNGGLLNLSSKIPSSDIKKLIASMLVLDAEKRPSIDEVFKTLRSAKLEVALTPTDFPGKTTLRGNLLKNVIGDKPSIEKKNSLRISKSLKVDKD